MIVGLAPSPKRVTQSISSKACSGAQKICGMHSCAFAYFNCGHENVISSGFPPVGDPGMCPLASYNVQPQKADWKKMHRAELEPNMAELSAICALCPHSSATITSEGMFTGVAIAGEMSHCINCPVHAARESLA